MISDRTTGMARSTCTIIWGSPRIIPPRFPTHAIRRMRGLPRQMGLEFSLAFFPLLPPLQQAKGSLLESVTDALFHEAKAHPWTKMKA